RPSRGWRESMATIRKYGRCFRPSFFMRIRTATLEPFYKVVSNREVGERERETINQNARALLPSLVLLPFLLPFFGPFLGALAVAGADLGLEHFRARHEGARLAQAGDHLDAFPDTHAGHLPHQRPHLVKVVQELLDLVRLGAAAGGDAAAARD